MRITPLADAPSTSWSGGTTTELFISPHGTSYVDRNFDVRISSATIDVDHSDFTALPGFDRYLAVLTEPLTLTVNGVERTLSPGQLLMFSGDDVVTSSGRTVDFNVMVRRGVAVDVSFVDGDVVGPLMVFDVDERSLIQLEAGEQRRVRGYQVRLDQAVTPSARPARPLVDDALYCLIVGIAFAVLTNFDAVSMIISAAVFILATVFYAKRNPFGPTRPRREWQHALALAPVLLGMQILPRVWPAPHTLGTFTALAGSIGLLAFAYVRLSRTYFATTKEPKA